MNFKTTYYKTPIGTAKIAGDKNGIQSISVLDEDFSSALEVTVPKELQKCVSQLDEYFAGKRTEFNLKLNPQGTDFQQRVWKELTTVSYGKARTYLEQSKHTGINGIGNISPLGST